MATDTDKFQGLCLIATEGWMYMQTCFDKFDPVVQRRLRDSPYNICPGCVRQFGGDTIQGELAQIERMENMIRLDDIVKKR